MGAIKVRWEVDSTEDCAQDEVADIKIGVVLGKWLSKVLFFSLLLTDPHTILLKGATRSSRCGSNGPPPANTPPGHARVPAPVGSRFVGMKRARR
jgi:hypothetical protein